MTNKEAIKELEEVRDNLIDDFTFANERYIEALDLAIKALEERPTGKWIPVSERLPKESLNSIIGWDAYRERCVFVQYIDGHFQIMGKPESFDITAWQPLPKPYKKGEEE